jgi:hypothetical protein
MRNSGSSEWEAVFLTVIGYYFKDRPAQELYKPQSSMSGEASDLAVSNMSRETTWQFLLAFALVVGTFFAFAFPYYKPKISGVWIGAVVLAIGFYFQKVGVPEVDRLHDVFRAILATTVTVLTLPLLWRARGSAGPFEIPLQWVGVVFIVVTFYFKEKATERKGAEAEQNISDDA